jgi:hypothetical protein
MAEISCAIRKAETPDGTVLLDVERGQMFSVNGIGSKILELLGNGSDEAGIAAELSTACGVNLDQVRADVHEFLEALSRHHILSEGRDAAHR